MSSWCRGYASKLLMGAMLLTLAVCVRNVEMRASEPLASESRSKSNTVKLTVDYGDGVPKRLTQLVWQDA